jgi:hypothetical protein
LPRLRQSEIEQLRRAFGRHLDIGRLEIPVDDALSCAASSAAAICRA